MLKIVYGIILDSFGELRQAHYLIEQDMANNCFICNVEKDECEKNNISFKEHFNIFLLHGLLLNELRTMRILFHLSASQQSLLRGKI